MKMHIHNKRISIITVVFNDEAGFKVTAKSIVNQTAFDNIEWIVIDAASTDDTVNTIKEYDSKITFWISEADYGIYDGMNKGIAKATSEYLLFLNAGDALYDINTIENVITHKAFGEADYLSGHTIYTKAEQPIGTSNAPKNITGIYLFKQNLGHQSTFIRANRLKQNGGYDISYKIVADAKFFFEDIIINNASYKCIDEYISKYDITGISSTKYQENIAERKRFLTSVLPPRIYEDYKKLAYGETKLEVILCKLNKKGIIYNSLTVLAVLFYVPIALYNRAKMHWRKRTSKRA